MASVLARRLKGQTFGLELDEIAALLQDAQHSVVEVADISRPTAQRYFAHMVRSGLLELHLRYGATDRPEHR